MKKYVFNRYSNKFSKIYKKEESKLKKLLGDIEIEHVGSTAVPELGGKGIIDIVIKTPKNKLNEFIKKLERMGYRHNLEHPGDDRRVFMQKIIRRSEKERRVHIHLTFDTGFYDSFISFRDYLRKNDKAREKYARIKKEAAKKCKEDGKAYRAHKDKFLNKITKRALKIYKK